MKATTNFAVFLVLLFVNGALIWDRDYADQQRLALMEQYVYSQSTATSVYEQMEQHWVDAVGAESLSDDDFTPFVEAIVANRVREYEVSADEFRTETLGLFYNPWRKSDAERLVDDILDSMLVHAKWSGFADALRWAETVCLGIVLSPDDLDALGVDERGRAFADFMNEVWTDAACEAMVWETPENQWPRGSVSLHE